MNLIRCEVTKRDGNELRTSVVYVLPARLKMAEALQPIVDKAIADLGEIMGPGRATEALLAELIERVADSQAYEREATRRGVLSL